MTCHMQLEIELDSLAQLEAFWGQLPPREHKAWSERAQVGSQAAVSRLAACMLGTFHTGCLPTLEHPLYFS